MIKKIAILSLLVIFFSGEVAGQINIDDIRTNADAVRFVESYGARYNLHWDKVGMDVYAVSRDRNPAEAAFVDSALQCKWVRSDFNNDGKNDLVFYGSLGNQLAVLSFVTDKGDSIQYNYLGGLFTSWYPSSISGYHLGDLNLLLLGSYKRRQGLRNNFFVDTLVYKYGGFIEFRGNNENSMEFDSIIYRESSNWMGVGIDKLSISRNGDVKLYPDFFQRVADTAHINKGVYYSRVDTEIIGNLRSVLGYIDYRSMREKYTIDQVFDLTTAITTVYYKGKMKEISDYGMEGTYGLGLLYRKFREIMKKCKPNAR